MDILTTSMVAPKITRTREDVAWVYNSRSLTGVRWAYWFVPSGALICCMSGNPAGEDFVVYDNFRAATERELELLDTMELKLNG